MSSLSRAPQTTPVLRREPVGPTRRRFNSSFRSRAIVGYVFIAPQMIGIVVFVLLPVVGSFLLSLSDWSISSAPRWVGLASYRALASEPLFWKVFVNTIVFTFASVTGGIIVSLLVALLLNQPIGLSNVYRSVYFVPSVVPAVAIGAVWSWLFNTDFGLINLLLNYVGIKGPNWLGNSHWAMPSLIVVSVWVVVGYNAMILLAGLKGISRDLYEAAALDGAARWSLFRYITFPLLSPTLFFLLVVSLIGSFQAFNLVFTLTGSGPGDSTNVLSLYMYNVAFRYFQLGKGAAISWVTFYFVGALTLLQFRLSKWVHYG